MTSVEGNTKGKEFREEIDCRNRHRDNWMKGRQGRVFERVQKVLLP